MNLTKDAVIFICIGIIILMALEFYSQLHKQELSNNELVSENEQLKNELKEYNNTEEVFLHYCVKCYCKDICQEAANELREMKGEK